MSAKFYLSHRRKNTAEDVKLFDYKITLKICKKSVHTAQKTQYFSVTDINWLMLFTEVLTVYNANHKKFIVTKCNVSDY